jgi:nitrogenase molybdenum-iron protein NifN
MKTQKTKTFTATRNACKVCAPLGASLAFAGIKGATTLLHGSQGCSTYIRRYMISHFKEPIDIASSNFNETAVIFGGRDNFFKAMANVITQYEPELIGIATTCLAETIGDDVRSFIAELTQDDKAQLPELVSVSTPSFKGTHAEGFHATVKAIIETLAENTNPTTKINILPSMISPEDVRYLRGVGRDCAIEFTILPDYSETLDGQSWQQYNVLPPGGTNVTEIKAMGASPATIQFGSTLDWPTTGGELLKDRFDIRCYNIPLPIGIKNCDKFFSVMGELTGKAMPDEYSSRRGRLLDSYADAHKYIFGKKAVLYGEEDLVVSMAAFLAEIGVVPVICATGAKSGRFKDAIYDAVGDIKNRVNVVEAVDFIEIEELALEHKPDFIIGNSKGFALSKKLDIPLLRIGFPVHDRFGGARIRHIGYGGTQELFDRIVNTVIEQKQSASPVGYSYM